MLTTGRFSFSCDHFSRTDARFYKQGFLTRIFSWLNLYIVCSFAELFVVRWNFWDFSTNRPQNLNQLLTHEGRSSKSSEAQGCSCFAKSGLQLRDEAHQSTACRVTFKGFPGTSFPAVLRHRGVYVHHAFIHVFLAHSLKILNNTRRRSAGRVFHTWLFSFSEGDIIVACYYWKGAKVWKTVTRYAS